MLTKFERQDDSKLIARALKGSEKAWLTLVKRYERRVYNYGLRISGHPDDAMDIMQDTFLAVYRNLQSYRGDGSFAAWLFRIAVFRATDLLRKKKLSTEPFEEATDARSGVEPEANVFHEDTNSHILKMLENLSNDARQIVELKFFQHFTFDEIAGQLGISTNTAKSRLYSSLKKMKEIYPANALGESL